MIYLDYNATTPLAPEAIAAMQAQLTLEATTWANPSSSHKYSPPSSGNSIYYILYHIY